MGTPNFAVPILKNIYQNGYEVTVVYSQPPRKSNRGQKIEKSPVHSFAETISFEVRTPDQLKNLDEGIKLFEPKIALDGGNDGLDVMRKVIYKSRKILKNNGMLAIEIGNGQYKKVSQILKLNKFKEKFLINDYKDNIRCILSVLSHY